MLSFSTARHRNEQPVLRQPCVESTSVPARAGLPLVYGPFRSGGAFTTADRATFGVDLTTRDPASDFRDFDALGALAPRAPCGVAR